MILALLGGCDPLPETVTMTGTIWDAPYGEGATVGGATIAVTDGTGATVDEQTADDDGEFSVLVPAGYPFFATVSADGAFPTGFSGTAGVYDFAAPDGYPWVATEAWVATVRETFSACPYIDAEGTVVVGEIRADTPSTAYADMPLVPTGTARVIDMDEVEYPACYLDDEGVSSADATEAGEKGQFVIFGVPAGEIVVDVRYTDPGGSVPVQLFRFVAPTDGVVPLYPALVEVIY